MGKKKALVVAINDYGGTGGNDLPSCINDADAFMRTALIGRYGFAAGDIRTLLDGNATIDSVERGLDWLIAGATKDDHLVFFFSGHGYTDKVDGVEEEFLVLRDPATGAHALYIDNRFASKLKDVPVGALTVVVDNCYSGGMLKALRFSGESNADLPMGKPKRLPEIGDALKTFVETTPRTWLSDPSEASQTALSGLLVSACLETETASASNSLTNGLSAFTAALLQVLASAPASNVAKDIFSATCGVLVRKGFRQTPRLLDATGCHLADADFVCAPVSDGPIEQKAYAVLDTKPETGKGVGSPGLPLPALLERQEHLLSQLAENLAQLRAQVPVSDGVPHAAQGSLEAMLGRLAVALPRSAAELGRAGGSEKSIGEVLSRLAEEVLR